ncbi:MAG TPA: SGNH/GDSL hydrolase family protein [Armatimonadota bacterium]
MTLHLAPHAKLVMIGDSVTDCERARPMGEGLFGAIGKGYVANVDALLTVAYPDYAIRVVNMGCSGNNVRDLKNRWQSDVVDLQPDWVSVMIGINDVWRQFDLPRQPEGHLYLEEHTKTLEELVTHTQPLVKGLVLLTPYYIELNRNDPMRAMMDRYGDAVKMIAAQHGTLLVDTQAAFDRVLTHYHPNAIAWDRVHPNHLGHMVLAHAFLEAIGYEWCRQGQISCTRNA